MVVDLRRCGPTLSPRVPNLVPIPGSRMERETPGQRPRPNWAPAEWNPGAERSPLLATLRSGPGGDYSVAAMITVPRRVMEGTGAVRTDDSGVAWRELHLWLGRTGWMEADRLEISLAAQTSYFDDPCATDGVTEGLAPLTRPTGVGGVGSPADHVAQMWHLIGPGCDRLHIALGTAWDYDSGGELAAAVPDEVTVEAFGSWACGCRKLGRGR